MKITTAQLRRYGKPVVFLLLAWPALWLGYSWYLQFQYLPNGLGFNPQEATHHWTGDWAMRFLILSLALTPLSKLIKSPKPILFRRMVGVYSFFYVFLHLVNYVWLDKFFAWGEIWLDILKRNYITIGMICFLLLIPLAVTSTKGWVKRMGARRWQKMHKLSYVIAPLVIVHFFMMRKGLQVEPLIYGAILAALLAFRLPKLFKR